MMLSGLKVFMSPDTPKHQLAPGDYVTPAFRKEIDAWLIEFLGTVNLIPDGEMLRMGPIGGIYMNPRTYAHLKSSVARAKP